MRSTCIGRARTPRRYCPPRRPIRTAPSETTTGHQESTIRTPEIKWVKLASCLPLGLSSLPSAGLGMMSANGKPRRNESQSAALVCVAFLSPRARFLDGRRPWFPAELGPSPVIQRKTGKACVLAPSPICRFCPPERAGLAMLADPRSSSDRGRYTPMVHAAGAAICTRWACFGRPSDGAGNALSRALAAHAVRKTTLTVPSRLLRYLTKPKKLPAL